MGVLIKNNPAQRFCACLIRTIVALLPFNGIPYQDSNQAQKFESTLLLSKATIITLHQLIRYGLVGIFLVTITTSGYAAGIEYGNLDPNFSLSMSYGFSFIIAYILHSRWSFQGHGERDKFYLTTLRFFLANIAAFSINQFFVWFLVKLLDLPTFAPIIPIACFTPIITFVLNRKWVFS